MIYKLITINSCLIINKPKVCLIHLKEFIVDEIFHLISIVFSMKTDENNEIKEKECIETHSLKELNFH